jgi:hypothetical protein
LSNFDQNKGHVMPRICAFWRWAMLTRQEGTAATENGKPRFLPTCPPALIARFDDIAEISDELRRFS